MKKLTEWEQTMLNVYDYFYKSYNKMTKTDRQKIFDKYGGKCAYCGCELQKGWHVDHVEPEGNQNKNK